MIDNIFHLYNNYIDQFYDTRCITIGSDPKSYGESRLNRRGRKKKKSVKK